MKYRIFSILLIMIAVSGCRDRRSVIQVVDIIEMQPMKNVPVTIAKQVKWKLRKGMTQEEIEELFESTVIERTVADENGFFEITSTNHFNHLNIHFEKGMSSAHLDILENGMRVREFMRDSSREGIHEFNFESSEVWSKYRNASTSVYSDPPLTNKFKYVQIRVEKNPNNKRIVE